MMIKHVIRQSNGRYLQKVAIFSHSRDVECICTSSNPNYKVIVVDNNFLFLILIAGQIGPTMDFLICCINFKALSFPVVNIYIFLPPRDSIALVSGKSSDMAKTMELKVILQDNGVIKAIGEL